MATLANLGSDLLAPPPQPRRSLVRQPVDPLVDTFNERFGNWNLIDELLRRQQGERTLVPGEQFVDPLGYRGTRDPTGYYLLRRF